MSWIYEPTGRACETSRAGGARARRSRPEIEALFESDALAVASASLLLRLTFSRPEHDVRVSEDGTFLVRAHRRARRGRRRGARRILPVPCRHYNTTPLRAARGTRSARASLAPSSTRPVARRAEPVAAARGRRAAAPTAGRTRARRAPGTQRAALLAALAALHPVGRRWRRRGRQGRARRRVRGRVASGSCAAPRAQVRLDIHARRRAPARRRASVNGGRLADAALCGADAPADFACAFAALVRARRRRRGAAAAALPPLPPGVVRRAEPRRPAAGDPNSRPPTRGVRDVAADTAAPAPLPPRPARRARAGAAAAVSAVAHAPLARRATLRTTSGHGGSPRPRRR